MASLIDNEIIKITNNDKCEIDEQNNLCNSLSNSNIELNYDTQHNILKTKINDKIIDIKFNKDCETKEKALYIMLIKYIKHIAKKRKNTNRKLMKHHQQVGNRKQIKSQEMNRKKTKCEPPPLGL